MSIKIQSLARQDENRTMEYLNKGLSPAALLSRRYLRQPIGFALMLLRRYLSKVLHKVLSVY